MNTKHTTIYSRLIFMLLLLLPVITLILTPRHTLLHNIWIWIVLSFYFWAIWLLITMSATKGEVSAESELRMLTESEQPQVVRDAMNVRIATEEAGVQIFRGGLREPAATVFQKLKQSFSDHTVPLIQEDEKLGSMIILLPKQVMEATMEKPVRPWLHWLLFTLTILTTTWAGAKHQGIDLIQDPTHVIAAIPYSFGLLAILGVHELGHYFTARHHGMNVTPPFFIPVPFALGTFGAFIKMKSPAENRRVLFDVAVAGPLAGLVIAIPALLIGLRTSTILPADADQALHMFGSTSVNSSLLFSLVAKLSLGDSLQFDHVVRLSPLAFAGWLGLIVTALNLLPIGQLDGGHTAHAMFGQRIGNTISSIAMWSLFLLALFVWPALMLWVIIIFFIAGRGAPPLNDMTPLTPGRRRIGYVTFAILASILIPIPHGLWGAIGFL